MYLCWIETTVRVCLFTPISQFQILISYGNVSSPFTATRAKTAVAMTVAMEKCRVWPALLSRRSQGRMSCMSCFPSIMEFNIC